MTIAGGRTGTVTRVRREEAAVAVFGTWMIIGLFLDGWAHQARKPETFFSVWHLLLYSGFVAAVAWFGWDGRRRPTPGAAAASAPSSSPGDRWMTAGLVLFVIGAVGDGIWHEVFGIEVNLEALLSPTHLLLFIGGFLMVTLPLRLALADVGEVRPSWPAWWPQALCLTLSTALVGFFTMYLSAFEDVGTAHHLGDDLQAYGIARILFTNALLIGPAVFLLRRWDPPAGTIVGLFTGVALLLTGLNGFREVELAVAPVLAGVVIEAVRRTLPMVATMAAASLVLWASYFAVAAATTGVAWSVELWAGAIVVTTASSALLVAISRGSSGASLG